MVGLHRQSILNQGLDTWQGDWSKVASALRCQRPAVPTTPVRFASALRCQRPAVPTTPVRFGLGRFLVEESSVSREARRSPRPE